MSNQPIGILDSGVGGLSIWREIVRELPNESTIYFADSKNCPYGDRSPKQIYVLAKRLVQFLLDKKVKLIVLACNTITVFCIDRLRSDLPQIPIVGTVPAVKTAAEISKNKRIGILSTTSTAKSSYQKNLIKKFAKDCFVVNLGTGKLVPLIEKGRIEGQEIKNVLKKVLKEFEDKKVDSIALGCSHFPLLRSQMENLMGNNVKILDSGKAIARQVRRVLEEKNSLSNTNNPSHVFYTTGNADKFKVVTKKLVGTKLNHLISSVQSVPL